MSSSALPTLRCPGSPARCIALAGDPSAVAAARSGKKETKLPKRLPDRVALVRHSSLQGNAGPGNCRWSLHETGIKCHGQSKAVMGIDGEDVQHRLADTMSPEADNSCLESCHRERGDSHVLRPELQTSKGRAAKGFKWFISAAGAVWGAAVGCDHPHGAVLAGGPRHRHRERLQEHRGRQVHHLPGSRILGLSTGSLDDTLMAGWAGACFTMQSSHCRTSGRWSREPVRHLATRVWL